jgi:uncharacterized protein YhjY with autotransporter beta-barrel domain
MKINYLLATTILLAPFLMLKATAQSFGTDIAFENNNRATGDAGSAFNLTLNGTVSTFRNLGMQGFGRIDATLKDSSGESFGGFSGMSLDQRSWKKNGDGSYSGTFIALGDRGRNDPAAGIFSDYRNRIINVGFNFTPYTGTATVTTPQVTLTSTTPTVTSFLKDQNGNFFTGGNPTGATTAQSISLNGTTYQVPFNGNSTNPNRISMDSEALAIRKDGSFYIGDEYTGGAYYFDSGGTLKGIIGLPAAVIPRVTSTGAVEYNSVATTSFGRRGNQGLEGLVLTPDGKKLVGLMQSALVQDTNGSNQQTRNYTRLMIWDVSNNATPTSTSEHYVVELPTFNSTFGGGAVNRTAAQSEILALNDKQFLVLSRDGGGQGGGSAIAPGFKSVMMVDISNATNIAGTTYETSYTPVATGGALVTGVTAASANSQLVNLINTTQVAKYGFNSALAHTGVTNNTLINEKFEGMALVSALDPANPNDYFLFVASDNDFITTSGVSAGTTPDANTDGDGNSTTYNDGYNNNNTVQVYRITLPTYIDPARVLIAQEAVIPTAFIQSSIAASAGRALTADVAGRLSNVRSIGSVNPNVQNRVAMNRLLQTNVLYAGISGGVSDMPKEMAAANLADPQFRWDGFVSGIYSKVDQEKTGFFDGYDSDLYSGSVGVDHRFSNGLVLGLAAGYVGGETNLFPNASSSGGKIDNDGLSLSPYLTYAYRNFYVDASYAYGYQDYDISIGLTNGSPNLTSKTEGHSHSIYVKPGWDFYSGLFTHGPTFSASYQNTTTDAYTLTNGNAAEQQALDAQTQESLLLGPGYHVNYNYIRGLWRIIPELRLSYDIEMLDDNRSVTVRTGSLGTVSSDTRATGNMNYLRPGLGLQSIWNDRIRANVGYDFTQGEDDYAAHTVSTSLTIGF